MVKKVITLDDCLELFESNELNGTEVAQWWPDDSHQYDYVSISPEKASAAQKLRKHLAEKEEQDFINKNTNDPF